MYGIEIKRVNEEIMIDATRAIHSNWFEEFNWSEDKCKLKRKEYGEFLSSYIRNQKKGLVLNLNSSWGTGKTHFLRQLYTDILQVNKVPVIHINAWKSDFSDDPLLVIISELLEQLSALFISQNDADEDEKQQKTEKILSMIGMIGKKTWNGSLDILAAYISTKNKDWETGLDATALTALANHIKIDTGNEPIRNPTQRFGESLTANYKKQIRAIEDTKNLLAAYANLITSTKNEENGKVVVLLDELDRCRPTYAIEMLETIKHFFDIDNFVFVIATDTQQLSHSINAVYGNNFNGTEYLSRFFNRTAVLPFGEQKGFIKSQIENTSIVESFSKGYMLPANSVHLSDEDRLEILTQEIFQIFVLYNLSLRRLEQLIAKFESIVISVFDKNSELFDFRMLLILLAEYASPNHQVFYEDRKFGTTEPFSLSKALIEELKTGTSDYISFLSQGIEISRLQYMDERSDEDVISRVRTAFKTSDHFMNRNRSGSKRSTHRTLQMEQKKIQSNNSLSNSGFAGFPESTVSEEHIIVLEEITKLEKSNEIKVWAKDDYFKAVELSSTITN